MKRILIIFSLFFLINNLWCKEKISVTYFDVPPHIFYDDSTKIISGAVYELFEYLAAKMDIELVWDEVPSNIPRQIDQLTKGDKDAAAVFIYNPNDLDKFSYSPVYFYAKDAIVVKKDNPLKKITKIEDILNLKIGYVEKAYTTEFMRDKRIKWEYVYVVNSNETNIKKILLERIDAVYAPDHAALLYEINMTQSDKNLKLLYTPSNPAPFCIGFSLKKSDIKKKFDETFKKFNGEQRYKKILLKYIQLSDK